MSQRGQNASCKWCIKGVRILTCVGILACAVGEVADKINDGRIKAKGSMVSNGWGTCTEEVGELLGG